MSEIKSAFYWREQMHLVEPWQVTVKPQGSAWHSTPITRRSADQVGTLRERALRLWKTHTQAQIAKELGVTRRYVQKLVDGVATEKRGRRRVPA